MLKELEHSETHLDIGERIEQLGKFKLAIGRVLPYDRYLKHEVIFKNVSQSGSAPTASTKVLTFGGQEPIRISLVALARAKRGI